MEIKDAEKTIDQADSFLTKLKALLKKHWGILTILLIGYFFYWALTTDLPEEPQENTPTPVNTEEPYVISYEYEIDEYGDTTFYYLWSDGVETIEY